MIEIENFDATIINLSKSSGVFKYSSLNPKIKTKLQPNKYYEIQANAKFFLADYECSIIVEDEIFNNNVPSTYIADPTLEVPT